ncbi:MAG: glycosyltransferase, partial [Umezawaea sp.]
MTQPVEAGVARVVLDLAQAQRARGWSVVVVCPPAGWLPDQARGLGIDVRAWHATRQPGPLLAKEVLSLQRILSRLTPDVVHLHSSKAGLVGRLAVRGRVPTVFQPHLWSFQTARGVLRTLSTTWERHASAWTDLVVCVSDDELLIGREAGVTADAEVVCNGVDTSRLRPGDRAAARARLGLEQNAPLAVCVGRLATLKGQDQLLTAWPEVLTRAPRANLVLVGDGPDGHHWRSTHPTADHASVR